MREASSVCVLVLVMSFNEALSSGVHHQPFIRLEEKTKGKGLLEFFAFFHS